jgi:ectoine hydroxylase
MNVRGAIESESNVREDIYPSRIGGDAHVLPRRDPVAHGACPPLLDHTRWLSYERTGYLFFPDFFTASEVYALARATERLRETLSWHEAPEVIREPNSRAVRSVFAAHRMSAEVDALTRNAQLLSIVEALLGSQTYVHQSRVNFKPGFEGKEFFWHSDFETWHVEDGMPRMRALSCSINLTDNNAYNGPVMVVPGSHRHFLACPGRTPEEHYQQSLVRQEYGVPTQAQLTDLIREHGIDAPLGGPGSLLVFDCNLVHGSSSNISPYPRHNVFVVFNSIHNRLQAPYCGLAPRPEHVASREHTEVRAPVGA